MNEQAPKIEPLLLSAKQVAAVLNIGESTIWDLHARGLLPLPIKLSRRTLWSAEELRDFVRAGCPNRQKWLVIKPQQGHK